MAKSFYQKFLRFKARHNFSNEYIIKLVTEYANSSFELARSHFTTKYNITEYTFYKARDFAIICCLVDYNLYKRIREKSSTNCRHNNKKNSAKSSLAHFDKLLVQQNQFLNEFSEQEIFDIGNSYAEGMTVKEIAMEYDTGEYAIKKLLKKGIVELIYDANLVKHIEDIVGTSLEPILYQRNFNKNVLLNCHQHQISFLKMKISYYDMYYRNESDKPSLESLKNELKNARKKYNETLKL